MPRIYFTKDTTLYLLHFGVNWTFPAFLVLEFEFFKNCSKFFENIKFKCLQHSPCNVLNRQCMLHEFNLCCSTSGIKGVLLRRNTLYILRDDKNYVIFVPLLSPLRCISWVKWIRLRIILPRILSGIYFCNNFTIKMFTFLHLVGAKTIFWGTSLLKTQEVKSRGMKFEGMFNGTI